MVHDSGTLVRANLHTHSRASAGKYAPLDHNHSPTVAALLRKGARCTLDCLAITDHAEAVTQAEWDTNGRAVATAAPPLLALRGFEWTRSTGLAQGDHMNILGTTEQAKASDEEAAEACGDTCDTVPKLYDWLPTARSVYEAPVVAQFNHVAFSGSHFQQFAPPPNETVRDIVALAELSITRPLTPAREVPPRPLAIRWTKILPTSITDGEKYWRRALAQGWRVSPTLNADNDGRLEMSARRFHTGIYLKPGAPRTREAVLEALAARRTFASQDAVAEIQLWYGESFMGSAGVTVTPGSAFRLLYRHPQAADVGLHLDPGGSIYVVDGEEEHLPVPQQQGDDWGWEIPAPTQPGEYYLYARIHQRPEKNALLSDGGYVYSAPIWFTVP